MKTEKIYLGKVRDDLSVESETVRGEHLQITKHVWDCGWYWALGYIGNGKLHCHAEVFIDELLWSKSEEVFEYSIFETNSEFWIFKDYLRQAYALKKAAEVYKLGGHCGSNEYTRAIVSEEKEKMVNKDLEIILNNLWEFLKKLEKKYQENQETN